MPTDPAVDLAHRLRWLMALDNEEFEVARLIEAENARLNRDSPQLLLQAWPHLTSAERRAWNDWLTYREKYE